MRTAESSLRPVKEAELCIVQMRDKEGFWCNLNDGLRVKDAIGVAGEWVRELHTTIRVVKGPKREVVRVIEP